jgi:hypothetical protein
MNVSVNEGCLNQEELDACLELLQRLSDNYRAMPVSERLSGLVCKLYAAGKKRRRDGEIDRKAQRRKEDRELLARSQLVQIQSDSSVRSRRQAPAPSSRSFKTRRTATSASSPITRCIFFTIFCAPSARR